MTNLLSNIPGKSASTELDSHSVAASAPTSEKLEKHAGDLEDLVAAMKEPLFNLADTARERGILNDASGLVIEGASAHFIGRFFEGVIRAEQGRSIPSRIIDVPRRPGGKWELGSTIKREITLKSKELGEKPLIVSDFSIAGFHCAMLAEAFTELGKEASFLILSAKEGVGKVVKDRGAAEFIIGTNADSPFGLILHNGALNGLVSDTYKDRHRKGFTESSLKAWDSFADKAQDGFPGLSIMEKKQILAISENLLQELLEEYLQK